jgi:hypothetical protein
MAQPEYWIEVNATDRPVRAAIRAAVDAAASIRTELRGAKIRIVSMPKDQAGATMVRGPESEAVRVLMNTVYDATGNPVAGCLVNG